MLKLISVEDLVPGMFVHEVCGAWLENPFWSSKFLLNTPEDVHRIRASPIKEVWVDTSLGLDTPAKPRPIVTPSVGAEQAVAEARASPAIGPSAPALPTEARRPSRPHITSRAARKASFEQARVLRDQAMLKVRALHHDVRMGQSIRVRGCAGTVEHIIESIDSSKGTLVSLLRLKTRDEYTYLHSVAVCALMKASIPLTILHKPDKLTSTEFALIKKHPELGRDILVKSGVDNPIALDVCLHHHQRIDGQGYPALADGVQLSLEARLAAICDVYDAVTSQRPYKQAWPAGEAIRLMNSWAGHFDPEIFQAFVKTVGIYPVGSLVRLVSNRLAVVLDQTEASLLQPRVLAFFDTKRHERVSEQVIDLSLAGCPDQIAGLEPPGRWNFQDLDMLWQR